MALAAKVAWDFQKAYAPNRSSEAIKVELMSDDEENYDGYDVVLATQVFESKQKEQGMHTVKPLLSEDATTEEETKDSAQTKVSVHSSGH